MKAVDCTLPDYEAAANRGPLPLRAPTGQGGLERRAPLVRITDRSSRCFGHYPGETRGASWTVPRTN